jgi:hypothetical protein
MSEYEKIKERLLNHRLFVMVYTFFIIAISSGTMKMIISQKYDLLQNKILIAIGIVFTISIFYALVNEISKILKLTKELDNV